MPHTLNVRLAIRIACSLLVLLLCLIAQAIWIKEVANEKARSKQLSSAREHYSVVLAELDRRWGREAFNLKARIESQNLLDGSKQHADQLLAFLISQGTSMEFPSLKIEKTTGEAIVAYDYASHVNPKIKFSPGQGSAWVQNTDDGNLYLVIRQFIWLGKENGYLLLFKPMDNALLTQTTYPGTRLSLWWKSHAIASSDGEDGVQNTSRRFQKPENRDDSITLTWSGPESENAPKLLIEILSDELIGTFSIAKPIALAFLVIVIMMAISFYALWLGSIRQLDALLQAEKRFASLGKLDETLISALQTAQTGPVDDLRTLAETAERKMSHHVNSAYRTQTPEV
jgi:hypothetical protein